jgi:hypothetical protein
VSDKYTMLVTILSCSPAPYAVVTSHPRYRGETEAWITQEWMAQTDALTSHQGLRLLCPLSLGGEGGGEEAVGRQGWGHVVCRHSRRLAGWMHLASPLFSCKGVTFSECFQAEGTLGPLSLTWCELLLLLASAPLQQPGNTMNARDTMNWQVWSPRRCVCATPGPSRG